MAIKGTNRLVYAGYTVRSSPFNLEKVKRSVQRVIHGWVKDKQAEGTGVVAMIEGQQGVTSSRVLSVRRRRLRGLQPHLPARQILHDFLGATAKPSQH